MPTKKSSVSKPKKAPKKKSAAAITKKPAMSKAAKETSVSAKSAATVCAETEKGSASTAHPVFKQWRIEKLEDIAAVDPVHIEKVVYFLSTAIRRCVLNNQKLVSMTYHEKGSIVIETEDKAPVEKAPTTVDPLS